MAGSEGDGAGAAGMVHVVTVRILVGDVREQLKTLPADSVNLVVTSPPYWALRDYGTATWHGGDPACEHRSPTMHSGRDEERAMLAGSAATNSAQLLNAVSAGKCGKCGAIRVDSQLGLEPTPQEHVAAMVEVFREVKRVLRADGVCFVNYGDSYAGTVNGRSAADTKAGGGDDRTFRDKPINNCVGGLKEKDLCLVPERFVLAMQEDGWWVRSRFPWLKRSAMPESISDRPATATEYFFMFTKNGNRRLWWRHIETREWRNEKPPVEYRWRNIVTRELVKDEPANWREERAGDGRKKWTRVHVWEGFDYWYDADAVRVARAQDEDATGFRGGSYVNGKPTSRQTVGNRGRSTYGRHTLGEVLPEAERRDHEHSPGLMPPHRGLQGARDDWKAKQRTAGDKYDGDDAGLFRRHSAANPGSTISGRQRGMTPRHSPYTSSCDQSGLDDVGRGERNFRNADLFFDSLTTPHGLIVDADGMPLAIDVAPQPFRGPHFATFPPKLIRPLILAGCPRGGVVLDPFFGAGTTGLVADRLGRDCIGIELNPKNVEIARARIYGDSPLFAQVASDATQVAAE